MGEGGAVKCAVFEDLKKKKKKLLRFWPPGQPVHILCFLSLYFFFCCNFKKES